MSRSHVEQLLQADIQQRKLYRLFTVLKFLDLGINYGAFFKLTNRSQFNYILKYLKVIVIELEYSKDTD